MTRDPSEVQLVARLLSEHVVVICTRCGAIDMNNPAGRRRHEQLYDHQLSGCETRKEGR